METLWIKENEIETAAQLLNKGEVVSFPTETVYGLGADATNEKAVKKIFEAKGRPSDNPLIVHISSQEQVYEYAESVPKKAEQLIDAFWPGPLTIVLNKKDNLFASTVTARLRSVGLRMPAHEVALELISKVGKPLAAPSANTSGKPSPTTAKHVYHDLNTVISAVVDGGETGVGLESTVLDMTNPNHPMILRPGGISQEDLEEVIGFVDIQSSFKETKERPKAPGMKYTHYTPDELVWIVESNWENAITKLLNQGEKIGILANDEILSQWKHKATSVFSLGLTKDARDASRLLYSGLRAFEKTESTVILAESYPKKGIGVAYMNRLEKAAGDKRFD